MEVGIFAAIGFLFAAYAVVGNDALQTLGTFINSNSRLHWFWLFLFAGAILVSTFAYGWVINGGDPSWGRLANSKKYPWPEGGIQWYHTLPPLALLIITRFGIPVSTTFMVLTVFASVGGLTSMLTKSLIGYGLAFVVGLVVYLALSRTLEAYFKGHSLSHKAPWGLATGMGVLIAVAICFVPPLLVGESLYGWRAASVVICLGLLVDLVSLAAHERYTNKVIDICISAAVAVVFGYFLTMLGAAPSVVGLVGVVTIGLVYWIAANYRAENSIYWILLQWITTAYLWGVWLIQDFANIFVFLPRRLSALEGFLALGAILLLLGYTFWNKGGPVQKILQAKTAVTDIRSATVIDFTYASLLFLFKEVSDIPMSTTFVFLGLIAGREYGFAILDKGLDVLKATRLTLSDGTKAFIGLAVSIDMAVFLPRLAARLGGTVLDPISQSYLTFIIAVNLLLLPVIWFLMKQDSKLRMAITGTCMVIAAAAFFIMPPA